MIFTNFIRGIVQNHPELKVKLKKASSKQTPFLYVYQTVVMTLGSLFAIMFLTFMVFPFTFLCIGGSSKANTSYGLPSYKPIITAYLIPFAVAT